MLQEVGEPVPRTHDLEALLSLLLPHDASLGPLQRGLKTLTQYGVDFRYPGVRASMKGMQSALRRAQRILREMRG